jgi:hypothetical protein
MNYYEPPNLMINLINDTFMKKVLSGGHIIPLSTRKVAAFYDECGIFLLIQIANVSKLFDNDQGEII